MGMKIGKSWQNRFVTAIDTLGITVAGEDGPPKVLHRRFSYPLPQPQRQTVTYRWGRR